MTFTPIRSEPTTKGVATHKLIQLRLPVDGLATLAATSGVFRS